MIVNLKDIETCRGYEGMLDIIERSVDAVYKCGPNSSITLGSTIVTDKDGYDENLSLIANINMEHDVQFRVARDQIHDDTSGLEGFAISVSFSIFSNILRYAALTGNLVLINTTKYTIYINQNSVSVRHVRHSEEYRSLEQKLEEILMKVNTIKDVMDKLYNN